MRTAFQIGRKVVMEHVFDTVCTDDRQIIELDQLGKSSWKIFGRYRYGAARPPRALQSSRETLVLAFFVSGLQPFRVDGEQLVMTGGMALCIPPGCAYGTDHFPEQKGELVWAIFDLSNKEGFSLPGHSCNEAREWLDKVLMGPRPEVFRFSKSTISEAKKVFDMFAGEENGVEVRARLGLFLNGVAKDRRVVLDAKLSTQTARVVKWIEDNVTRKPCSMEKLASVAGLSVSRFQTKFKENTGISPADYQLQRKLLEAQRLLKLGKSVTEVAMSLGFSSSQYFATAFKRYMLVTPSQWVDDNV